MREHPRRGRLRRLQLIRHALPEEALVAMMEPDTGTLPPLELGSGVNVSRETTPEDPVGPYVAGGQVPAAVDYAAVAALQEAPPALSPARRLRLEALTAQWVREVREGGPGPDDTLLYSGPSARPPVPPASRPAPQLSTEVPNVPNDQEVQDAEARLEDRASLDQAVADASAPPARVSAWASRHDPRSLEYSVRDRLRHPVPLQNVHLALGPILDQGATPPLTLREASACVGMGVVAARNVLELESAPGGRSDDLRDEDDARVIYRRAQELDHVSGEDYAGTSVLAGMKAGQEAGYWDTYLWALGGTRDVAQSLLQLRSPVVVGVPWSSDLEDPDAAGIITPGGSDAGGHVLAVVGLRLTVAGRPGPWFALQQSRGLTEGRDGVVYLHHSHLARLLAHAGEAAVPLPRWGL